jgi:hypothetical protein
MFQPLLGHHQEHSLCLVAEHVVNMNPCFDYDYLTCNIVLDNETLDIIYNEHYIRVNSSVFWDISRVVRRKPDVSEKHIFSHFRIKQQAKVRNKTELCSEYGHVCI